MKVKSESEVAQSCPTLSDPIDCSPPGSSIHGIFQARVLEWGAIAFSDIHTFFFFNCFWLCWVFSDARGLSPVVARGGCSAAALCRLLSGASSLVAERGRWGVRASVAAAPGPQSTGSAVSAPEAGCPSLCGIFRTGIHPVSPALAGGLLATEPPGTPYPAFFKC